MLLLRVWLLRSFIGLTTTAVTRPVAAVPATTTADYEEQTQIRSIPGAWQQYVRSPRSTVVTPVAVLANYTEGSVTNPDGLLTPGGAPTVLTRKDASSTIPQIVVDFGQNIEGFLSIKFAGASNSSSGLPGIRLAFSETIQYGYLTNVSDFSRSDNGDTITPGSDQIAVQPKPYTWTETHGCDYGKKVCADGFHGFRYVKIYLDALPADAPYTSSSGSVSIDSMSLNFTGFLGTPSTFTGWFQSSDDNLNQYWYDGVYTNDMCIDTFTVNTTDPRDADGPGLIGKRVLMDGAKRDHLPYIGDLAVSARTLYVSHDAADAAYNVLADMANHQRADGWIPPASINNYTLPLLDYPLWWVACTYDLVVYTGNTDFANQYYQTIVNVLDKFYPSVTNPATKLITKGYGVSGGYGDYAFLARTGPVTYYNALYVIALNNAASIAKFLGGHDDDAARWTSRAQDVSAAIQNTLFDSSAGAFYDGTCGHVPCETHAQDGNSLSIVSGAANSSQAGSVLNYLSTHMSRSWGNAFYDNDVVGAGYSQRVYAFISYFELEARFLSGSADTGLEEIRRLYSFMADNGPGVTFWEGIQSALPYEQGFTSMAHGWSTGVVPALTNYVLGVTPTGPGFSTFLVKPMPGDITWANGEVPTPLGAISVQWTNDAKLGLFVLNVNSPPGTKPTISIPADSSASVFVNGEPAFENGQAKGFSASYAEQNSNGYVTVQVSSGKQVVSTGK